MNDIGREAKSLFEAARHEGGLPGPKRARIKQAVLLQAATLGAASSVAGGAVAMSVAAKVTLVTVTAAVLGGGSVSIWAWKQHKESTSSTRAVPTQPRVRVASARPAVVSEPAATERPAPAPPSAEPQRRGASRAEIRHAPVIPVQAADRPLSPSPTAEGPALPSPAERHAGPPSVTDITPVGALARTPSPAPEPLDSELTLLRQAQEDLRRGLPAQALGRLAEFDRRFPKARLDQERQAIEAIASCQAYPGPAATARAQRFLQKAPLSPLAARVRSACQVAERKSFNETGSHREP